MATTQPDRLFVIYNNRLRRRNTAISVHTISRRYSVPCSPHVFGIRYSSEHVLSLERNRDEGWENVIKVYPCKAKFLLDSDLLGEHETHV